jgi:hypothetical protein
VDLFPSSSEGWETSTLLGPLERANLCIGIHSKLNLGFRSEYMTHAHTHIFKMVVFYYKVHLNYLWTWLDILDAGIGQSVQRLLKRGRSSSPGRGKTFLLSKSSRPVLGPKQFHIRWVWVTGALSSEECGRVREAGDLLSTNADVKITWINTSTP